MMQTYDRDQALRCFGDEQIFQAAVATFLEEIDAMLEKVKQAVVDRDFEEVKEKAHWVKGGLVYLHATPSANAARDLEDAADSADSEALGARFESLLEEVQRLKKSLASTPV